MEYKFRCPKCGCDRLEEIMENVTVSSVISSIHESLNFNYSKQSNEGGEIVRYQCMECGYSSEDDYGAYVNTPEDLVEWIKNHKAIRVIVVVRGGCVEDVVSDSVIEYDILDYDNEICDEETKIKNKRLGKEIEKMRGE